MNELTKTKKEVPVCPFNTDILCRHAALIYTLRRELHRRDHTSSSMRWVRVGNIKTPVLDNCEECANGPEKIEEEEVNT